MLGGAARAVAGGGGAGATPEAAGRRAVGRSTACRRATTAREEGRPAGASLHGTACRPAWRAPTAAARAGHGRAAQRAARASGPAERAGGARPGGVPAATGMGAATDGAVVQACPE